MSVLRTRLTKSTDMAGWPGLVSFINPNGILPDGTLEEQDGGRIYKPASFSKSGNGMVKTGASGQMNIIAGGNVNLPVANPWLLFAVFDAIGTGGTKLEFSVGYNGDFIYMGSSGGNTAFAISDDAGSTQDSFLLAISQNLIKAAAITNDASANYRLHYITDAGLQTLELKAAVAAVADLVFNTNEHFQFNATTRVYGAALFRLSAMPVSTVVDAALVEVNTNWRNGEYKLPTGLAGLAAP